MRIVFLLLGFLTALSAYDSHTCKLCHPAIYKEYSSSIHANSIDLKKTYKVSSWGGNLQNAGENLEKKKIRPVYEVVSDYIRAKKVIDIPLKSNVKVLDFDCGCPQKGAKC